MFIYRIDTCMEALKALYNQSKSQPTSCNRSVHILSCDDIVSPPLWCLLLVHSPQYLRHLWKLSCEAKKVCNDLYAYSIVELQCIYIYTIYTYL